MSARLTRLMHLRLTSAKKPLRTIAVMFQCFNALQQLNLKIFVTIAFLQSLNFANVIILSNISNMESLKYKFFVLSLHRSKYSIFVRFKNSHFAQFFLFKIKNKILTNELVQYIHQMKISCYGLTIADLRTLVNEFCEKNKIIHPFNKDNKMTCRDFVAGFLKRHSNVSLRKPEAISLNRVYGLNEVSVDKYFENLAKVLDTYNLEPQQIFNLDESELSCVHKPNKVLAQEGKRVVSSTTNVERGVTTTIMT